MILPLVLIEYMLQLYRNINMDLYTAVFTVTNFPIFLILYTGILPEDVMM